MSIDPQRMRDNIVWHLENTSAGTPYGDAMFANAAKRIRQLEEVAPRVANRDEVIKALQEANAKWNGSQTDRRPLAEALFDAIEPFLARS